MRVGGNLVEAPPIIGGINNVGKNDGNNTTRYYKYVVLLTYHSVCCSCGQLVLLFNVLLFPLLQDVNLIYRVFVRESHN